MKVAHVANTSECESICKRVEIFNYLEIPNTVFKDFETAPPPSKLKHKIFWKASLLLFCPRSSCQLYFEFLRETDWSRPAEGNVSYSILHIVFSYDTHAISHGKLTPPMRTSMHLCICINSQKQEPGIKYNTQKSLFLSSPLPLKLCAHVVDLILTFSLGQC